MKELYKSRTYRVIEDADTIKIKSKTSTLYMIIVSGVLMAGIVNGFLPGLFTLFALCIVWLFFFIRICVCFDMGGNKIWKAVTFFDKVFSLSFYAHTPAMELEFLDDSSDSGEAFAISIKDPKTKKRILLFQVDKWKDFSALEAIFIEKNPDIKITYSRT